MSNSTVWPFIVLTSEFKVTTVFTSALLLSLRIHWHRRWCVKMPRGWNSIKDTTDVRMKTTAQTDQKETFPLGWLLWLLTGMESDTGIRPVIVRSVFPQYRRLGPGQTRHETCHTDLPRSGEPGHPVAPRSSRAAGVRPDKIQCSVNPSTLHVNVILL